MQPASQQILTCPTCGAALEETFAGKGGCMFCLLQAGIGSEEETLQDSTPDALEGGMRFGVYEIDCHADGSLRELGRGAMGVTYRATDTSLQRHGALKIIKTDIAERSADARERFIREARAAAALRHEHIATVYQFGVRLETGQYFYAMELIEGETLDERVRRAGPLDARTIIGITEQVTSALAAAEEQGLVHRDLKPANLMLVDPDDPEVRGSDQARSKRGRIRALRKSGIPVVKIIDFGLAKAFQSATDPTSLTHDKFVGTPAFASPEQIEHSALDVRSDIYSLGETLWFALTGKTPFTGRTLTEILRAQKSNVLPSEQLKVADLKVISRTSVMQYRNAATRNLRDIAQQLGVAHVLEGSVQRAGNRVRVSAQLIDARTDSHLWAERYDRDVADVFGIQSEIAKTIADQLQAKISPSEKAAIEKAPTTDLVAYDRYLRAQELFADTSDPIHAREKLPQAAHLLEEAVTRDPHFLQAWCLLSRVHGVAYFRGHDHTPARLDLAYATVQAALRLQEDAGEAHLALANYYYHGFRDYGRARSELAIAQRTLPNSADVFRYTGFIDRREGHWEAAPRNLERAVELHPRNFFILQQLALTYQSQRRYTDEARTYDRALTIVPSDPNTRILRALIALDWRADIKPFQATLAT